MSEPHVDVVVVGAGISGIGAAYHLTTQCPDRTFTILEGRADIGGTWDLFRYPGVRSDSDMHTLGFRFAPWADDRSIAGGEAIRTYLERVVDAFGDIVAVRDDDQGYHGGLLVLDPVESSFYGAFPTGVARGACALVRLRLPGAVDLPVAAQAVQVLPEAGG